MLAMLNWNLPELARILPDLPPRFTIVSAGDPMWRGGLSAPQSVFLHADRPMISENGTSTLLHELGHIAMATSATRGYDWIVEGFAEYYSLQLMLRSGTLTPARFEDAMEFQQRWAEDARTLCGNVSSGSMTALAVTRLHALNEEIAEATEGEKNLDDVWRAILAPGDPLDLDSLVDASASILGQNPDALHIDNLPGCRTMAGED